MIKSYKSRCDNDSLGSVLDVTAEIAEIFSELQYGLKKDGNPIPINNVWIASGAVVITYDNHFRRIPGIRLWDW
jgi:tRNA(fMet)-specific endonuclease VapC